MSYSARSIGSLSAACLILSSLTPGCAEGDGPADVGSLDGSVISPGFDAGNGSFDGSFPSFDGSVLPPFDAGAVSDSGSVTLPDGSLPPTDSSVPSGDASTVTPGSANCGSSLLDIPSDPSVRGPWEVGVRTVKVGRLTIEVLYPAAPGSTAGKPEVTYDIRDWLPPQERSKVPDDASPAVTAIVQSIYCDVPIDSTHGPYPAVVFIHGTASFRIASGSTNVHWASRGFVVLAADYPGLGLQDQLSGTLECNYPTTGALDIRGDVEAQLSALKSPSGDLAFLGNAVDVGRIGISGHSQGGCQTAVLSDLPGVQIAMPLSGSKSTDPSASLKSVLYVSGISDTVIPYDGFAIGNIVCPPVSINTKTAYADSPGAPKVKKRVVGITNGGHLLPTDLCQTNAYNRNAIQEAQKDNVCGIGSAVVIGLPALFDCGQNNFDWKAGVNAVNYVTTAALEETLFCRPEAGAVFENLKSNLPLVGDFDEDI